MLKERLSKSLLAKMGENVERSEEEKPKAKKRKSSQTRKPRKKKE